jgi:carboxyl-terminal processing protease
MPKNTLIGSLLAISLLTPTLASPAQDLFDQATFLIGFNYNGSAKVPGFRELRRQYQPRLDQLCATEKEQCSLEKGRQVVAEIVRSIPDPFMGMVSEEQLENDLRYGAGLGPLEPWFGVWVNETPKGLVVTEAFAGNPAFVAGLRRGDLITSIAGQPATQAGLRAAEASKAATEVAYTRQSTALKATLSAQVAKQALRPRFEINNKIAYLRIYHVYSSRSFSVADSVYDAVRRSELEGAKGIIIDLRDALSGYDSEALLAAGAFIPKGGFRYDRRFQGQDETYTLENGKLFNAREGEEPEEDNAVDKPILTKLPVVVLVNRNTLNSTEMFAYFLQSVGRAKVVGEATAGVLSISGGAEGPLINGEFVAVSSLRMQGLDGKVFPDKVTPDIVVADDLEALLAGRDVVLQRATELLK